MRWVEQLHAGCVYVCDISRAGLEEEGGGGGEGRDIRSLTL